MDTSFDRLSLLTQTAYAQLLDQLLAASVGDVGSEVSLVSKKIRGRRYWYAQTRAAGGKVQRYLGPDSPEIERLVERWQRGRSDREFGP